MYMGILHYVCLTSCVYSVLGGQKRTSDPKTGVTGGCKLLCECWEVNQPVLLTAESSSQSQYKCFEAFILPKRTRIK